MTTIANSVTEAHEAIEARIAANWGFTPVQYPNKLGLQDGAETELLSQPVAGSPWLRVDVIYGDSFIASIAGGESGMNRNTGVIQLKVYVPRGEGMAQLNELKGWARQIFSRFVGNGLACRASSSGPDVIEAGWMVGVVRTPFEFYETES
jgi:hypothetical protein